MLFRSENYEIPVKESFAFDLLGNTVVVPIIKAISERILDVIEMNNIESFELENQLVTALYFRSIKSREMLVCA